MDIWFGNITKHLQNVSKGKVKGNSCSEDLSSVKLDSPRLGRDKKPKEEKFGDCLNGENVGLYECSNAYGVEVDSCNEVSLGNSDEILSDSVGKRAFLRRKRRYKSLIKPNGVMSRLHREKMSVEEYMFSPFPSPCGSVSRALLVTDGTQVISKNAEDSIGQRVSNCGIPQLRKLESSVLYVKRRPENSASGRSGKGIGSNDARLLLCVGISIGILSSFVANQTKVNKVEANLKQTENLEDELKTKNSMTVKDDLQIGQKQCDEKTVDKSISKIEAELEAELERLEINMNSSNIQTRLSDVFELEPEFEAEFAKGELRDDQVKRQDFDETESNQEPSENSTPEAGKYTVSPRELSLRLHKLINSRHQERIKELETALQESQRKVEQLVMESEEKKKPLSSTWKSHEVVNHKRDFKKSNNPAEIQPLVMNLSGEALDAFKESYEELMDINDYSEEDDIPFEPQGNEQQEELSLTSKSSPWSHKDNIKDSSRTSEDINFFRLQDLLGPSDDDEEDNEFESEMEKQLIKQIVEKTKQGSCAVINAQKMLFLMEDIEHNL